MKLAILFFGMSKCTYKHWRHGEIFEINYKKSYDNYQEYLFDYFKNKGYAIDIYFSTNEMDQQDRIELIDTYKPVDYMFSTDDVIKKQYSRNKKIESVIDLCLNSKIQSIVRKEIRRLEY